MISTLTTVPCPECRHENEPERIYCHGCGARLARSKPKVTQDDVEDTRKRMEKMFDPRRARMRLMFFKFSKVLLGACGAAALLLIALPPDVPPAAKTVMLASQLGFDIERVASRHQAAQLNYTEDQVNAFLDSQLKSKKKALDEPLLDFKRAVVGFHEGACALTIERSLFGYSLYTTIDMVPTVTAGKMGVTNTGGKIGRLPVHPKIAPYLRFLFTDLSSALDREKKLVAKMSAIECHDKKVALIVTP